MRDRERLVGVEGEEGMVERLLLANRLGRVLLKLRCKLRYLHTLYV